ncbi:MAG: sigma 54-interacting transcriptional regulator [Polyangiales bacterium]
MGDDLERTLIRVNDFGFSRTLVYREPQLRWRDQRGSHSALIRGRVMLGSADDCSLVLYDPMVSRLHASIEVTTDGIWVRDLGSRNGTYVAGVRVREACVPDGAAIHIGDTDLWVYYDQNETVVDLWPTEQFGPLWGRSVIMRELFARLARVAAMESTVLIQGETGTGKELVARAVHNSSRRREKPLVVVDCGALAENLLEAELFGHARGAFTGASHERAGAIESAAGGTVFLDEIGEMPLSMQPKLLRALESRQVRRVGESRYRDVDVRFIAATHRDLAKMVNDGTFREDLFFRLSVLPVTVPPLRERLDDIPLLVQRMMPEGAAHAVSPELLRELSSRAWSGNVRELRNFVERAVALGAREALTLADRQRPSSPQPASAEPSRKEQFPPISTEETFKDVRDRWLDHLEREYMRAMVARFTRDTSAIANASGLDRSYVYRMLRKHEL